MSKVSKGSAFHLLSFIHAILTLWFESILITLSGGVETNPGPKRNSAETISFCHWNLNNISSHNYVKISLLKAYMTVHKFDIICLSETYLDSSTRPDDDNLEIEGYDIARAVEEASVSTIKNVYR